MTTTGAAAPQVEGQRRNWRQRARYIGATLALELVLGGILTLGAILGTFLAPTQFVVVTQYRVADNVSAAAMEQRVSSAWTGPGVATARPLPAADEPGGSVCGPHAIEVETVVRAHAFGARDLLAEVTRAAQDAGLATPCSGARVRMSPAFGWQTVAMTGNGLVAPLLLVLVWRSRRGRPWFIDWADWTPQVNGRGAVLWGIGTGVAAVACALGILWLSQLGGLPLGPESMSEASWTRADVPWLAPLFVCFAPVVEEYVFRAWMLERFRRVMPTWLALALSSLAFAAMHAPQHVALALVFAVAGLLLGLNWLRTRSWLSCVLAHGFYNGVVLTVMWVALPP